MKKYYGDKEVVEIKDHPVHDTYQVLVFSDGTTFDITKKMLAASISDKPVDLTTLRNMRCFPVVSEILKTLLEWDVHISEIEFIDTRVIMSVNESLKKANEIKWGVEDRHNTMLKVHDVLMSVKPNEKEIVSPYVSKKKS